MPTATFEKVVNGVGSLRLSEGSRTLTAQRRPTAVDALRAYLEILEQAVQTVREELVRAEQSDDEYVDSREGCFTFSLHEIRGHCYYRSLPTNRK